MKVSFEGIGETVVTFYNNGAAAGDAVKLSANGKVAEAASGERFMGVCTSAEADFAAVQISGVVTMPYTGTAPSVGYGYLLSDGTGGVKVDSASTKTGGEYLILDVDTTAKTAAFIL
jgi:hypothetical protein